MLKTVEGMYQDGQIQLSELPEGVSDRAQVLVTFLQPGSVDPVKIQQLIDQLETIAGIQQGLEAVDAEQTRPLEEVEESLGDRLRSLRSQIVASGEPLLNQAALAQELASLDTQGAP
nr:hypothetical protein [Nodosilinea sp. LEGE 07298]